MICYGFGLLYCWEIEEDIGLGHFWQVGDGVNSGMNSSSD